MNRRHAASGHAWSAGQERWTGPANERNLCKLLSSYESRGREIRMWSADGRAEQFPRARDGCGRDRHSSGRAVCEPKL